MTWWSPWPWTTANLYHHTSTNHCAATEIGYFQSRSLITIFIYLQFIQRYLWPAHNQEVHDSNQWLDREQDRNLSNGAVTFWREWKDANRPSSVCEVCACVCVESCYKAGEMVCATPQEVLVIWRIKWVLWIIIILLGLPPEMMMTSFCYSGRGYRLINKVVFLGQSFPATCCTVTSFLR